MPVKSEDKWAQLRKPFDKSQVGKLPRGGIQLDYVGHANVTDRLLAVDPEWTWEPMATDEHGMPLFTNGTDQFNKPLKQLWIRLTILGVTRPGVGDGKSEKECIGDAIRNAAMRFGVALDLWSKEELESQHDATEVKPTIDPPAPEEPSIQVNEDPDRRANPIKDKALIDEARKVIAKTYPKKDQAVAFLNLLLDKDTPETIGDYQKIINSAADQPF